MFQMLFAFSLLVPLAVCAQDASQAKESPKASTAKKPAQNKAKIAAAAAPNTTPDGAEKVEKMPPDVVEVRTDVFRRVDENGKAWIYRRMVFGIFKSPETENMRQLIANPPDKQNVRMLPDGTLEFTKMTPFGVGRYTRKMDELSDEEKEIWEKAKKDAAAQPQKTQAKEQNR